jgi:hypothetical protein
MARRFDNEMAKTIQALNGLRNAMAHSFLPENKRDYRKTGMVTWKGKDIYKTEGIEQFNADMLELQDCLFQLAFGKNFLASQVSCVNDRRICRTLSKKQTAPHNDSCPVPCCRALAKPKYRTSTMWVSTSMTEINNQTECDST